jgi:hypothetical protein
VIERKDLDLPAVGKAIWLVHEGLRSSGNNIDDRQEALFDCGELGYYTLRRHFLKTLRSRRLCLARSIE